MEKNLTILLLDEIVRHCETIKLIKDNSNKHAELRKILKENYNITHADIENLLESLNNKVKYTNTKEIEKLDDTIINLCKLVNISYKEKDSNILDYSKIRSRVSNMRHSTLKKKKN